MTRLVVTRRIGTDTETVFDTVANIDNYRKAVPGITKVEFLSEQRTGARVRIRETRRQGNVEATEELEVTEYVPNDRVRIVSDTRGTVWTTIFRVEPDGAGTTLTVTLDVDAYRLLPRLLYPLVMGAIRKAIERDLDAVKAYCEARP